MEMFFPSTPSLTMQRDNGNDDVETSTLVEETKEEMPGFEEPPPMAEQGVHQQEVPDGLPALIKKCLYTGSGDC